MKNAAFLALIFVSSAQAQSIIGSCSILPADNIWNTAIDQLPKATNSNTLIQTVGPTVTMHADFGSGTYAGGPIGIPFVPVPGTQTKYPGTFLYSDESDPGPYAIPLTAPIEGGSASTGDRHAITIDTDNCILYEIYRAFPQASSWKGDAGAIFNLRSNALRPVTWTSADAAGLPILPGLVTYEEVAAGQINHAIRLTVPHTLRAYVWPARHYASSITDPSYPAMGQRFRLRANFDVSTYPSDVQVILRALKKYGLILADNGSAWFISGKPDSRWNNDNLHTLQGVLGSDLEAVDATVLMIDPNSGQAKQNGVSVQLSPATSTVHIAHSVQFTSNVAANWSVNGIAGGNGTVGFVDTTGRYSAPTAVPSPATVQVQATSIASPGSFGTASVTILPSVSIISVSPSSIPVGSFTLTVNGTGFLPGSVVTFGGADLATTYGSAAKLTATGTASSAATSVPVVVHEPDQTASNTVTVSVVQAAVKVTISPTSASVRIRRTHQFTATVQNSGNQSVTWKVNGTAGGNATVGTISSTGLYQAPASVPSPSTVTVTAVSVADVSKSASASVRITRN